MARCSPCKIWTCFSIRASVNFWTVCGTTWWWWMPSPDPHSSCQRIMFFTASPDTLTSWCDSSFICKDNRAALLFVSNLNRVKPSSWSLGHNWLRCRSLEEVMILWTLVWFVSFAAAGQVNSTPHPCKTIGTAAEPRSLSQHQTLHTGPNGYLLRPHQ